MAVSVDLDSLFADARSFLTELAENNTRDWFHANKARYDNGLKRPAERLMDLLTQRLSSAQGTPVKPKLFRPHRDMRFSEDKTPYHTHLHILWSLPDGRSWFMGIAPDYATAGAGMMAFEKHELEHYRSAVAGPAGDDLAARLTAAHVRLDAPSLKKVPPPYPADHPHEDNLRRKGLVAWRDGLETAMQADILRATTDAFVALNPITDWLADHVAGRS